MFTRTREKSPENLPEVLHVPKNIQNDIEQRGFHLYKWISPDEVKLSIQRDFLKTLKFFGIPLAVISLIFAFISGLSLLVFFFTIFVGVCFMFIYLLLLSIKRSRLLTKSAFVIMTDSSISLGGKIHKLSDISGLKNDIDEVSETFEEDLFGESRLDESKKSLSKDISSQLFGGYEKIFSILDRVGGKDSIQGMLILMALYTIYIAIMACVYFIGVLGLIVFGQLMTWLNTKYLIYRGQNVIKINKLFGDLDISSDDIRAEKTRLKSLLKNAHDNEWKDGLLLEINAGIRDINTSAQSAVEQVLSLKNTIHKSRYKDMFSFEVYNSWIKKQISKPLEDILTLLEKNQDTLIQKQNDIALQIKDTEKIELKSVLKLQVKRIKMQLKDINKFIPMLEDSITKLK